MDTNYGISMNSILRMDILHDARLLAGASGTDQIVTSVSVMVDPNIVSAVTGGELLVSTAYAIRENLPQLMELIPQLKERGVVGLGLKFNSYINEIPQNILDLCNQLSFPLFEIPNSISFSQIITPIMTTIVNNQAQTLGDIYELQKALTATMLGGGNLQSIVQTLLTASATASPSTMTSFLPLCWPAASSAARVFPGGWKISSVPAPPAKRLSP